MTDEFNMIPIPSDKFNTDLSFWFDMNRMRFANSGHESDEFEFLSRLSCLQVIQRNRGEDFPFIEEVKLSNEEIIILKEYLDCDNIQFQAFSYDLLRKVKGFNKLEYSIKASQLYMKLYEIGEGPWFIVRSISIRSLKVLKDHEFIKQVYERLEVKLYPGWIELICQELRKTYSTEELALITYIIERKITETPKDKKHRDDERDYYNALLATGKISKEECLYLNALSYEKEVDFINETRGQTICPNSVDLMQKAYDNIYPIRIEHLSTFERIQKKLLSERGLLNEFIVKYGVKITRDIPDEICQIVDNFMKKVKINTPYQYIDECASIPFPTEDFYKKTAEKLLKSTPLLWTSFGSEPLGERGQTIGKANPKEALKIESHLNGRTRIKYMLSKLKFSFFENCKEVDENELGQAIMEYDKAPKCIETERRYLWARGIVEGVKGDFIVATHLLMPQVERALVKKAEEFNGPLLSLDKSDHQDECGIAKALSLLKPHMTHERIYDELYFFLTHGADTNLRNKLAHGLLSIQSMMTEGPYLWWLAVKLYFKEEEFFTHLKENNS